MHDWLENYKPATSACLQLLLAALMWSVVGTVLACFGAKWVWQSGSRFASALVVAAAAVGVLKARLALDRAATRIVERIKARGDGKCLGGFLSWRTWLLVAVMAGSGRLVRASGLVPMAIVGFIYAAVGTALLVASRRAWLTWHRARRVART